MADDRIDEVLKFWLDEVGPDGWYAGGEELDRKITERYLTLWEEGRAGGLTHWRTTAKGTLALVIVLDQFPRNMFRGSSKSFATDQQARATAKWALQRGLDRYIARPQRQFFYMPLEHSESAADQAISVASFVEGMPEAELLIHARAHREIIRRFGRFPFRNEVLGRVTSKAEQAFLDAGAYRGVVEALRKAA